MSVAMTSTGSRNSRKSCRFSEAVSGEVVLELAQAFGSRCGAGLRDAVKFADAAGQHMIHLVGRYVSFRHVDRAEATFVIESPQVVGISACALSRSRSVLAVCEVCQGLSSMDGSMCAAPSNVPPSPVQSPARGSSASGTVVAAAEAQAENLRTQVTLYNLKVASMSQDRQPLRTLQDVGEVGHVIAAALSGDVEATFLAVASKSMVAVVEWRKNVVIGRYPISSLVNRLSLSPLAPCVVAATGPTSLRLWTFPADGEENVAAAEQPPTSEDQGDDQSKDSLVVFPLPTGIGEVRTNFTDHAWLEPADGTFATCTEQSEVHIVLARAGEASKLLRSILPFVHLMGREMVPTSLHCFAGGLLIGGEEGILALWEQPDSGQAAEVEGQLRGPQAAVDAFEHVRTAELLPGAQAPSVACFDLATQGEDGCDELLVGFTDNAVGLLPLEDFRSGGNSVDGEAAHCSLLCGGSSPGPVSSLDMAAQRPVIASACRQECSIRLWNYATRHCDLKWVFPGEEPTCVSLHPTGFLVAVGFSDRLRVFQVLVDNLKPFREMQLRGVRALKFSNGGHLLAVAHSKTVVVFGCRSFARVAKLQHSQQVVSLSFHPEDRLLTTCSEDGSIVEWSGSTWSKVHEFSEIRGSGTEALAVGAGFADMPACVSLTQGGKSELRFFKDGRPQENEGAELPNNVQLLALCQCQRAGGPAIFGAGSTGALFYRYAMGGRLIEKELPLHSGPCLDVRISADGSTLVTAGEDGIIFVINVQGLTLASDGKESASSGEVVMISRGEIQAREEEIQQLAVEAASLKVQLVEDAARMQSECLRRVAEARKQDQEEIKSLRIVCEAFQAEATATEREALRQMKAMEATHLKSADQLESDYDREILSEADRFRDMEAELVSLAEQLVNIREESSRRIESERGELHQVQEHSIAQKDAERDRLKEVADFSEHRFNTMLDQEAMEQELEREEQLRQGEAEVEQQKIIEYKLKKEQDTILRGLDMMEADRARAEQTKMETDLTDKNLTEQVDKLQAEVDKLKQERRDREANLRDKELEIGSYKVKVNTLKKFKHVLDFRLREVTLSLQPKDDRIAELGSKLKDLEEEFENNLDVHKQMEARLKEEDGEMQAKLEECDRLREVIKLRERDIYSFAEDLRDLATKEPDVRQWPAGMRAIARKHVKPERLSKDYGGQAMQELLRQIDTTEVKADKLARKGRVAHEECATDLRHRVEENFELIRELDKLRKERKELNMQVKEYELKVQTAEKRRAEQSARQFLAGQAPAALRQGAAAAALRLEDQGSEADFDATLPEGFFGAAATAQVGDRTIRQSGSTGSLRKSGVAHRSPGERRAMQKLLAAADLRNQQVQFQAIEHKLLKDQLVHLQSKLPGGAAAGKLPVATAAGGGAAVARLAAG